MDKKQTIENLVKSGEYKTRSELAKTHRWVKTYFANQKSEAGKAWLKSLDSLFPENKPTKPNLSLPTKPNKPNQGKPNIESLGGRLVILTARWAQISAYAELARAGFPFEDQSEKLPALEKQIFEIREALSLD